MNRTDTDSFRNDRTQTPNILCSKQLCCLISFSCCARMVEIQSGLYRPINSCLILFKLINHLSHPIILLRVQINGSLEENYDSFNCQTTRIVQACYFVCNDNIISTFVSNSGQGNICRTSYNSFLSSRNVGNTCRLTAFTSNGPPLIPQLFSISNPVDRD